MRVKAIVIFLLVCVVVLNAKAQFNQGNCPNNIDFEFGNFQNWKFYTGQANNLGSLLFQAVTNNQVTLYDRTQHAALVDQYGNFPVMCPNGSRYSVQLGEDLGGPGVADGGRAERLTYTFVIPAGSVRYSLTYYYAAVLNNGGSSHNSVNQARFTTRIRNLATGADVGCSFYDYNAQDGATNGFVTSPVTGFSNSAVYYKNWTPVTVDLSGLNGQTLELEFTTNDCHPGAHAGYAYIDIGATCITPITGYAYCTGATSVTLTAPFGYQAYNWIDPFTGTSYGSGQILTLTPPPPAGTVIDVDLIPVPFGGCRDTLQVTMVAETAPDTPVAVSNVGYCLSDPAVPLVATNSPGFLLQWYSQPTGGTASPIAPTPNTSVLGSTDYYVSQISFGGCEGPRKKITVTVAPPPNASFSINDTIQCFAGNSFVFTNTSSNSPGVIYSWDFGDATPNLLGQNATHAYAAVGSYTVKLNALRGTCLSVATIQVQVVANPIADFTATNACVGDPVVFTNTTSGGTPSNQFTWNFGNGNTSNQTNPSFSFSIAGTNTVSLTVNAGDCSASVTKPVLVYARPRANFTFNPACVNSPIQFIDQSTISIGTIISWNWDFGGGITSSLANPIITFTNSGTRQVKLTVASANCTKDTTIAVTVYEKPTASFVRSDTACVNQIVSLNDASFYASGAATSSIVGFWWNAGNGSVYSTQNITPIYTTSGNAAYTIKQVAISDKGCISDTNIVTINVKAAPIAQAQILTPLCELRPLEFEDVSVGTSKRQWTFSTGYTDTAKKVTVANLLTGVQNFKLQITDVFGCKSAILDSNIVVDRRPKFEITYSDSCVEKPVPMRLLDANGNITNWFWILEGNTTQDFFNRSYRFAKSGPNIIQAYASTANGCVSDTLSKTIQIYKASANAGVDKITLANQPVQLSATGGVNYIWIPALGLNNAASNNPIATVGLTQRYEVVATNEYGCTDVDDVTVTVYKGPDIYVPTIFTPNNDGVNDVLKLTLVGIKKFEYIKIFNRFGQLVFETKDAAVSFNGLYKGVFLQPDTYVFYTAGEDIYGKQIFKKGTIVMIR
jgi:gliding motility-associated-like protein